MRNSYIVFINLKTDHASDLDHLLSITNSVINLFWPPDPSNPPPADGHLQGLVAKHSITNDVGAFCYTFSILLLVASEEAIWGLKEEVKDATSSMLRILEEDTELVANATRTTCQQLGLARYALNHVMITWPYRKAVTGDLIRKLDQLCHLAAEEIQGGTSV